jgi:hypothetical protein
MEIGDALSSLLYGQLEVDIRNPTHLEQLEIVRAIVANPGAIRRLKIVGDVHPWVSALLDCVREQEKTTVRDSTPLAKVGSQERVQVQGQGQAVRVERVPGTEQELG